MEVRNWTRYIQKSGYVGVVSGVRKPEKHEEVPARGAADTVTVSEEARRAAMAAEMEQDGMSRGTAVRLASGRVSVNEPDWETFELPSFKVQADAEIYHTAYSSAVEKGLSEITKKVEAYYGPEYGKLAGMDPLQALDYLFRTYRLPYMEDVFTEGTELPSAPQGMSEDQADMAYRQLRSMYFHRGITLRDPYALGEEGLKELDCVEERARQSAQEVYDAAQKEVDAGQERFKTQRKEEFKKIIAGLNSGTGICLGYMSLRPIENGETGE